MTTLSEVSELKNYEKYLNHGFVALIDVMGDDAAIDQAARCSYGNGTRKTSDMRGLIRYLMRHQHTSPIEMVEVKFHIKLPIYIMRQFVRHRTASLNELSARYSELPNEFYIPEQFYMQSTTNKQGSGEEFLPIENEAILRQYEQSLNDSYEEYESLLKIDVSRETARGLVPPAVFTECYWKIDLKNFFHFIKLRNSSHAQKEIRVMAEMMYNAVKPHVPLAAEAFEDYWRDAVILSRMEVNLVKEILKGIDINALGSSDDIQSKFGMSKRELNEFKQNFSINI